MRRLLSILLATTALVSFSYAQSRTDVETSGGSWLYEQSVAPVVRALTEHWHTVPRSEFAFSNEDRSLTLTLSESVSPEVERIIRKWMTQSSMMDRVFQSKDPPDVPDDDYSEFWVELIPKPDADSNSDALRRYFQELPRARRLKNSYEVGQWSEEVWPEIAPGWAEIYPEPPEDSERFYAPKAILTLSTRSGGVDVTNQTYKEIFKTLNAGNRSRE